MGSFSDRVSYTRLDDSYNVDTVLQDLDDLRRLGGYTYTDLALETWGSEVFTDRGGARAGGWGMCECRPDHFIATFIGLPVTVTQSCICMHSINSVLVQKMFTACIQPCCTYLTAVCCFYDVCTHVGVVKIGIIFTDGKATRSFEHHLPTLDNLGVRRFAVPINSRWDRQGMQRLASIPPGLHVLTGRGIHTIDYLVDTLLSGRFCRGMYMCVYVRTYALVVCKLPT